MYRFIKSVKKVVIFVLYLTGIFAIKQDSNCMDLPAYNGCAIKPNTTKKMCIQKCCPKNTVMITIGSPTNYSCLNYTEDLPWDLFRILDADFMKTNKSMITFFNLIGADVIKPNITRMIGDKKTRLLANGYLVKEKPNYEPSLRWTYYNNTEYCLDFFKNNKGKILQAYFVSQKISGHTSNTGHTFIVLPTGFLVSSVFLALVLLVYSLLPELRNLRGLVLMSYIASFLIATVIISIQKLLFHNNPHNHTFCKFFTYTFYFFMLSSFFWMNIMSFDIWWTFRGLAEVRLIHRRGEWFKYLMYCAYAYGVPFIMTVAVIVLVSEKKRMEQLPWFITPKITICFLDIDNITSILYQYVPLLIILIMNTNFFIMTLFNIWRITRQNKVLNRNATVARTSSAHLSDMKRFVVYVKLFAIMGMSWLFEVTCTWMPDSKFCIVTDIYNSFTGIMIFFIFACKKKIWWMLRKRYSRQSNQSRCFVRSSTTRDHPSSTSCIRISQETPLQPINCNPKQDDI